MRVGVSWLLQQLANEMNDLFVFLGEKSKHNFPKRHKEEGFVVDTLAYYDPRLKKIFFCEKNFLESARGIYNISDEKFLRVFALYVLLHEFTHYALDLLGFQNHFHRLPDCVKFDEPFCEYVSLRACISGRLKLFNYEREVIINESEKRFLPFLSSMSRPAPYCYFREIYARPENLLGKSAEIIFLKLKNTLSKMKTPIINPDQNAIFRLLLTSQPISLKEIYRRDLKRKIRVVGIINAPIPS